MVLGADPSELGLEPSTTGPVWGVVMDTVMEDGGWYCVATLAEGTTSLYTSGAFGIIGAGGHTSVRQASQQLLAEVAEKVNLFEPTNDQGFPAPGMVAIRALTFTGQFVVIEPEDDLGNDRVPVSPIFHSAHNLIGHVRMIDEQQQT
jgi:hypothetical protein